MVWSAVLLGATLVMRGHREAIEQSHVALVYLLIVLGGSLGGGRALGFALACAGFLLLDYYFQLPFDTLSVNKPMDWVALLAFLATAAVTTQLLTHALAQAEKARQRTEEVARLSKLGSRALNAGRAEEGLVSIAETVRGTLGVSHCEIYRFVDGVTSLASAAHGVSPGSAPAEALVRRVAEQGRAVVVRLDGSVLDALPRIADGEDAIGLSPTDALMVLLPLQVDGRVVGVLRITDQRPMALDAPARRFLSALAYYAALGVERARLAAEAEHAEALREVARLKDVVLASVSHDLRTPLTTIKALAQSAAARGDESARLIEEQADRLGALVSNLLDISRLRGGAFPVSVEPNTAEDVVGVIPRHLGGLLAGRTLNTSIDMSQQALVGRFDFVQTLRILSNLIENALRYSAPECAVDLSVTREASGLRFAVADRGPGVPVAERERIFEPFYRMQGAPPDAGGVGLGLSIARHLAQAQGGSLHYEPRPGGGSVFVLTLPVGDTPVLEMDASACAGVDDEPA